MNPRYEPVLLFGLLVFVAVLMCLGSAVVADLEGARQAGDAFRRSAVLIGEVGGAWFVGLLALVKVTERRNG